MPKKEKIEEMFDSIAPSYDQLNHLLSLGIDNIWRKKAIREIVDGTQQQILDVACGTGDSTIAIAKAMAPGGRVTGIDISASMMEPLMRKASHEGVHDRIKLLKADALQMP
ncbi:MAG: class I SAM-dependent methyltransferase, partial [Bacteroidales bacterium]|nr:class I SAM-dependent methyltransferase [Bacteroidales bacterium]